MIQIMEKTTMYLKKYITKDTKIGIWVSGWPDSMALLDLLINFFQQKKFSLQHIIVIHCDHNLRTASHQERNLIKNYLPTEVTFYSESINPKKSTKEATLRQQRYEAFQQYIQKYDLEYFLLGHNLSDRIESSFLNLLRGCDLKGFLSMKIQNTHHLLSCKTLRPLLDSTKQQIQNYCDSHQIPYCTDESNNDSNFSLRNKLRNEILPNIMKLSNKYNSASNTFTESLNNIYTSLEQQRSSATTIHLKKIFIPPQRKADYAYKIFLDPSQITLQECSTLFEQLHTKNNITQETIKAFVSFFNTSKNGYKYLNKTYFFLVNHELFVIKAPKDFWKLQYIKKNIDKSQLITKLGEYHINGQKVNIQDQKYLNYYLGHHQRGMRFKGKTRNKYCINNKIPLFYRNSIPLIYHWKTIINYFYPLK